MVNEIYVWNDDGKVIPRMKLNEMKQKIAVIIRHVEERLILPNSRFLHWEAKVEADGDSHHLLVSVRLEKKSGPCGNVIKRLCDSFGVEDQETCLFHDAYHELIVMQASVDEIVAFIIEELNKPFVEEERALSKRIHNPAW